MTQRNFGATVGRGDNVLNLFRPSVRDSGATALDLVLPPAKPRWPRGQPRETLSYALKRLLS
jgi:hypothetical protein